MKNNHLERMAWLDSIRAIAALLVVFQHYFYDRYFIGSADGAYLTPAYEVFRSINFGKIGVIVFFFISGFIIPQNLSDHFLLPEYFAFTQLTGAL